MLRYAFDNDWPIEKCEDCPIVGVNHSFNMCMFQSELNPFGRILKPDEGVDSRPSWCPLQPLDDASLDKHADATLTSTQHFVNISGPFPVVFDLETIRCHGCGETFVALIDVRHSHCPRCGAKLDVTCADDAIQPSYALVPVDYDRLAQEVRELREKLDG